MELFNVTLQACTTEGEDEVSTRGKVKHAW